MAGISQTAAGNGQRKIDAKMELARSLQNQDPIRGIVGGTARVTLEDGKVVYCAQIFYEDYNLLIPESEFTGEKDLASMDRAYVRTFMESRIGSPVYFIVTTLDVSTKKGFASRKMAEKKRIALWTSKDKEKAPKVGDVLTGDVVALSGQGAWVNISGAEAFIKTKDLSFTRLRHPAQEFTVGQSIRIKITDIKASKEGVSFYGSHKDTVKDPAIDVFDTYLLGGVYIGELTSSNVKTFESGKVGSELYVKIGNDISIKCPPPYGLTPYVGQNVKVEIKKKSITLKGKRTIHEIDRKNGEHLVTTEDRPDDPDRAYFWGRVVHVFVQDNNNGGR